MIDFSTFKDLASADIGPFAPKPTCLEGDQQEAARTLFESVDGSMSIGIWECTPGRFTADRTKSSETCHIISGRVEMRHVDGKTEILGPGDLLVLPQGWAGEWRILERTRKLYIIKTGADAK
ncbi:MAG TPA: cupin domain-containing protein [Terriglobales bacterium]|nr:cupin domain-containing protein [Terriglobales bacterium]